MSELKPCPFCGFPANFENVNGIDTLYYAVCSWCAAQSTHGTKEKVTEAWNNRAYEDKLREELKKVIYVMSLLPNDEEHNAKGILARVVHELWPEEEENND